MHGTYQNGILDFKGVDSGLPHWETWHVIQKSGEDTKIERLHRAPSRCLPRTVRADVHVRVRLDRFLRSRTIIIFIHLQEIQSVSIIVVGQ